MNNRSDDRKPLLMNVQINCPNFGMVFGQTANVSRGGMYIENKAVVIPKFAQVNVSFQPDPERLTQNFEAPGRVAHQGKDGFGISFEALNPDCQRTLAAMIGE